jgi:hypothetical protein
MRLWINVGVVIAWLVARPCAADTLEVGPGRSHATPCEAVAVAKPQDVIEINAGTYTDSCSLAVQGLTLRGVNGQPKIDLSASDHPAQYKGIYVIDADDITIENLELTGAHISDDNGGNAAGLRVQAAGLTVRGCNIHDNQNGILGGTTGTLTIEHSELANNGVGDGCNQGGCTHNLYIANIDTLNFRFNWSHKVATDTSDKGHLLKSRAKNNFILYNRLSGEDGFDSYEINLPNGGLAVVVGNLIQKGPKAGNSTLFSWGEEGATNPDKRVFLASNTFVNDYGAGTFVSVSGATLTAHNNLFIGPGTLSTSGMLSADNLTGDPLFVDRAQYDYHLSKGSPAIGIAVDPGMADQFSLKPVSAYAHPLLEVARSKVEDVGAYEFSQQDVVTPGSPPAAGGGGSAGRPAAGGGGTGGAGQVLAGSRAMPSAGTTASAGRGVVSGQSGDNGAAAGASGGSSAAPSAKSSRGGCGCQLTRSPSYSLLEPSVLAIWLGWGVVRRSERRRRRSSVRAPVRAVS